jgi:hypothetical protein
MAWTDADGSGGVTTRYSDGTFVQQSWPASKPASGAQETSPDEVEQASRTNTNTAGELDKDGAALEEARRTNTNAEGELDKDAPAGD